MTFFRRERHLTELIQRADPVAAKRAPKPRYVALFYACALLIMVCRFPAPWGHLPAATRHLPALPLPTAETATLSPFSSFLAGRGTDKEVLLSPPSPRGTRVSAEGGRRLSGGGMHSPREAGRAHREIVAVRRRHTRLLRKRAYRAPAPLVAQAPEPQGGMIVIAVRPMTTEELQQELNIP